MPIFDYKGLNDRGKTITGVIDADSANDLRNVLLKTGIFLTEYAEKVSGDEVRAVRKSALKKLGSREVDFSKYFGGVKTADLAVMTRQFGTLLKAGIPLVGGLNALADQVENRQLQAIIKTIKFKVNEGSSLADALSEHKVFSSLYINMVRVGEATGTLDIVMLRLADFMDAQVKLKSKLISSMIYPVLLICIAVVIVSLMMLFVIPRITEMFEEMGADLPFLTLVLIGISTVFGKIWWLIIIAAGASFYYFKRWRETEQGRYKFDSLLLKIPIFGKLIRLIAVARFARTLSTLLSSGVPILTSK
ncbi:MAG: type II secretion system F family protein, partial [Deltaproteobacteria bacterium]|nr:type II secretion system F family protein [Deltaproteobacteria bacterium]